MIPEHWIAYGFGHVTVLQQSRAYATEQMLFYSFFKTLVDTEVTVELKNDLCIKGTLSSVDQFLNIKLRDITVLEELVNYYSQIIDFDMLEIPTYGRIA